MKHAKRILVVVLWLAAAVPTAVAQTARPCPASDAGLDLPAGYSVEGAARTIASCAGIAIEIRGSLGALATGRRIDLDDTEGALAAIMKGKSWIAEYGSADDKSAPTLRRLVLYGTGEAPIVQTEEAWTEPVWTDPEVAKAAAVRELIKLANRGGPQASRALRHAAVSAKEPAVRRAAMSSVAGLKGATALALLTSKGLHDPDPSVRLMAAERLAETKSADAIAQIRGAALRERDPDVRVNLERWASDGAAARD